MLIYQARQDDDALDLAAQLIERFRGLGGVLAASASELKQLAPAVAEAGLRAVETSLINHLKIVREVGRRVLCSKLAARPCLSSMTLVRQFLSASLRHKPREEFRVLFLDYGLTLIADETLGRGSITFCHVSSREVIRRALELSASSLILVHNHPSGLPNISKKDHALTLEIQRAGLALGIEVQDHLIVAGNKIISLRDEGLL